MEVRVIENFLTIMFAEVEMTLTQGLHGMPQMLNVCPRGFGCVILKKN